jgi:hypothetical protein
MLMTRQSWLLIAAILSAGNVRAQSDEICATYAASYEDAPLMQVKSGIPGNKVHLQSKAESCPPAPKACASRQRAYLVPGDKVFAGPELRGFRCAYYGTAKGDIVAGFLPASTLESAQDDGDLSVAFLSGTWTMLGGNPITFTPAGDNEVEAKGNATWQGPPGVVHYGSFSARAQLQANLSEFRSANCEVKIRRRGPYLIVGDNGECGGMNVHFEGIYVKRTK